MEPQTNNGEPNNSSADTVAPKTEETPTNEAVATESTGGVSEYRTFAIIGYILPILFFLPLLDDKTKHVPYVRFHANQQLILLVVILTVSLLHSLLFAVLMALVYIVAQLLNLAILALVIFGAYNAYHGRMKELPAIGQFRILK